MLSGWRGCGGLRDEASFFLDFLVPFVSRQKEQEKTIGFNNCLCKEGGLLIRRNKKNLRSFRRIFNLVIDVKYLLRRALKNVYVFYEK